MAKRLTDTDKWKDDWYISLSNDDKIVWQWLLDNCSHAALCKRSIGLLNLMCRVNYTEPEMIEKMSSRVIIFENFWFIPKFLKFQYTTLFSQKPVILSVVKELFQNNCISMIPESFPDDYKIISKSFDNHCQMIKDKDKSKDKEIKKGGVGENKNGIPLKGVKIDSEKEIAIFEDGSKQELGQDQKFMLKNGGLSPSMVIKGHIY